MLFARAFQNHDRPAVNFRPDVGLSDADLILIPTKDLNKLLKKKGISKERAKEIKQERRTLKNRYTRSV